MKIATDKFTTGTKKRVVVSCCSSFGGSLRGQQGTELPLRLGTALES